MIPAFVGFCAENQSVLLNHEHTEYRWCSLAEAPTLAVFSNQRKLYDFIWENFVLQQCDYHYRPCFGDESQPFTTNQIRSTLSEST